MRILLQTVMGVVMIFAGAVAGFVAGVGFSFALKEVIAGWPTREERLVAGASSSRRAPDKVAGYEIAQGTVLWRVSCRGACDSMVSRLGAPVWRIRAIDGRGRTVEDRRLPLATGAPTWVRRNGESLILWEVRP